MSDYDEKMGMTIEEIPIEILMSMINLAGRSAWKTLRSVNRTLSSLVTPLLFSEVEVWIETQSLLRLQSIASSTSLSKHVKSLIITNDYITTKILSPSSWIGALMMSLNVTKGTPRGVGWLDATAAEAVTEMEFKAAHQRLRNHGWTRETLFEAWTAQKNLSIEQVNLQDNDKDIECLACAFRSLPNLSAIRFSSCGIGGPRKLRKAGITNYYNRGDVLRADGRQLSSVLLAAALISSSLTRARIASFVMDVNFWTDWNDETYMGTNNWTYPDFGTIQPSVIESTFPFLADINTLELSIGCKCGTNGRQDTELNLSRMLVPLPKLEHLTVHNTGDQTLRLRNPLASLTTTSLRTLNLEYCLIYQLDLESLLKNHDVESISLRNIGLLGARFIGFFTSLRNSLALKRFAVDGWLVETGYDNMVHGSHDEEDDEMFHEKQDRRKLARKEIEAYVLSEREHFPSELCDIDSSDMPIMDGTEGCDRVVLDVPHPRWSVVKHD